MNLTHFASPKHEITQRKIKKSQNYRNFRTGSRKSVICVLVAIGTEIAISAKSQNCNNSLKSNYIGLGKVNEAYDTNFSHKI